MIKSSSTFIALLTYTILNITREATSTDQPPNGNNPDEKNSELDNDLSRLQCLLFKDIGCDIECFVINNAFGKLGSGVCDEDNICQCTSAENPSLAALWTQKFRSTEELILGRIQASHELSNRAYEILATPFKTGLQIKETLKEKLPLSEEEYNELQVIDPSPAAQMNPKLNEINLSDIEKYVDKALTTELKSRSDELSAIDLETTLLKVLNDNVDKSGDFEKLKSEIRRIQNTYLNSLLNNYLIENHMGESTPDEKNSDDQVDNLEKGTKGDNDAEGNEDASQKAVNIAETLSYTIANKLVKKVKKPKSNWLNWFKETITNVVSSLLFSSTKPDNNVGMDKVLKDPTFFILPPKVNRKLFRKSKPIDQNWRDNTFTLRYRRDGKGFINLNWIKKPVLVSILKTGESKITQNWSFGTKASINIFQTKDEYSSQIWDFGTTAYYLPSKTWRNGQVDENSLMKYKGAIRNWCDNNKFLIDKGDCIIFI